jgi:glycosyltransferase involved in cell wall biosynthesis
MTVPVASVVLVGPLPPPSGGMANQTRQLARLLNAEGIEVVLVQVNAPYRPAWTGRLRGARALFRLLPYLAALWRAAGRCQVMHVMANSGWSWHLFAAPAVWIAKLRGIPVVINYRGGEAESFFAGSFAWVRPTLRQVAAIAVPSGFLEEIFRRRGFAARIVPNIIDLEHFAPQVEGRPADQAPHLVVTRNLEDIYDIPTALRAFARLHEKFPAARLSVAGSGPRREDLERLARELGIAEVTTFTGRLDNADMASLYRSAHLMLNASRVDNLPISILEALASGVPVVSTDVGGIPHLVEHERTALLVSPGDPEAMAEAAGRLWRDRLLSKRLRTAGLALARQYAWCEVRDRLFAVYRDASGKRECR